VKFSSFHEHNFMKHIKINIILRVIKLYTRKNLFNEIEHKKNNRAKINRIINENIIRSLVYPF
jgi:hypothetical protein